MNAVISPLPAAPAAFGGMLADDKPFYEIIDGKRVELPPMSILASKFAGNLHMHLGMHVFNNRLGETVIETLLHLPLPVNRNRRPGLAFVSAQTIARAPIQPGSDNAWEILPELLVEVVSPNDLAEDIAERINEYFAAGAKQVWVAYPTQRLVYIYESPRQVRILGEQDELDGGDLLPGFRLSIASLIPK